MFLHHQEAESAFPPSSPGAAPGPGPAPRRLLPQRPRPRPSAAPPPPPDRPSARPPADVSRCVAERKYTQEQARKELQQVFIPECNEDGTYSQVCPPRPGARPPARRGEARRAAGPGAGGVSGAIPPSHRQQVPGPRPRQRGLFLGPGVAVTAALSALPVRPPCSPSPGGPWTASSGSRRGHATRPRGPPALPG